MANPASGQSVALILTDPTTRVFLDDNLTADGWQVTAVPDQSYIARVLNPRPSAAVVSVDRITVASPQLRGIPVLLLDRADGRDSMLVGDTAAPIAVCQVPFSYPVLRQVLKTLATWRPERPDGIPANAERVELPFSEVCMHLRVAGQLRWVAPIGANAAQIYGDDGRPFSIPVTRSEAGLRDLPITISED